MRVAGYRLELLDPRLFWRKLALLVVFSAAFIPLKYYRLDELTFWYVVFLLVLHVYFAFILVWRVRWRRLAEHGRSFLLRLVAVAFFIALLAVLKTGVGFAAFMAFLAASLVIHTFLILSLTVVARRGSQGAPLEPVPFDHA